MNEVMPQALRAVPGVKGEVEPVTNSGYGNELFSVQLNLDNAELLTPVPMSAFGY